MDQYATHTKSVDRDTMYGDHRWRSERHLVMMEGAGGMAMGGSAIGTARATLNATLADLRIAIERPLRSQPGASIEEQILLRCHENLILVQNDGPSSTMHPLPAGCPPGCLNDIVYTSPWHCSALPRRSKKTNY